MHLMHTSKSAAQKQLPVLATHTMLIHNKITQW